MRVGGEQAAPLVLRQPAAAAALLPLRAKAVSAVSAMASGACGAAAPSREHSHSAAQASRVSAARARSSRARIIQVHVGAGEAGGGEQIGQRPRLAADAEQRELRQQQRGRDDGVDTAQEAIRPNAASPAPGPR